MWPYVPFYVLYVVKKKHIDNNSQTHRKHRGLRNKTRFYVALCAHLCALCS